jgi:Ca-activated chloride channel family protein
MEKDLSFHDNKKWEERFYIFVFPVILVILLWFRRGFTFPVILFFILSSSQVAGARNLTINDRLFLNKDQLAQKALEEIEDFDTAIKLFDDPYKKGVAYYKSGNFQEAAKYFRQNQRPEMQTNALYNLGNALTKQNKLDEAINTYQQVLDQNPDHEKAKHNMKIAKLMLSSVKDKKNEDEKKTRPKKNNNDFPNGGGGGGDDDDEEEENDSDGMDDKNNKDKNDKEDDDNETEKNNTDKQDDKSHTSPDKKNNDTASGDESEKPNHNSSTEGNEQEGKDSSDSTQEIDVDQWLNKISNDHKNFLKNQFYLESQTQNNNNNPNLDPW